LRATLKKVPFQSLAEGITHDWNFAFAVALAPHRYCEAFHVNMTDIRRNCLTHSHPG
jgi:hypothetical protein